MTTSKTRAEFEAWYVTRQRNLSGKHGGDHIDAMWSTFQAALRVGLEEAVRALEEQLSLGYDAPENRSFRTGIQFSIRAIRALAAEAQPAVSEEAPQGFWMAPMMLDVTMLKAAADTPGMRAIDSSSATMQLRGYPLDPKAFEGGAPLAQAWIAMGDSWLARALPAAKGDENL